MKTTITIDREQIISKIDERLYSSFIEHMGRAVYTGIYEPDHPSSDSFGFRKDVEKHIGPLKLSHIRYPGGNFLSGYRWEDGIGPQESRPVRRDLAWFAIEPNLVGINEFVSYCRRNNIEPMIGVNLGTRGAQDASNLLEYCNVESGTYYSDLRRSHGYEKPHNIKLWCLGNEMDGSWQICAKTAEEYGRLACETAKMMKWMDPEIELVACGSSFRNMPTFGSWERTVLKHCWEYIDYLSLHQYYQNNDGDLPSFLANSNDMDIFIKEVASICSEEKKRRKSNHDVKLSFDEWNVWYHFQKDCDIPKKWIFPRPVEEEIYDFADALVVGGMLTTLINNSDNIKIACMAQLVNVIAPIMTTPKGESWLQTIYYPFLYTSQNGRGTAMKLKLDCDKYSCKTGKNIPVIDCAAVLSKDQKHLNIFIINKELEKNTKCVISLNGFKTSAEAKHILLSAEPDAINTLKESPVYPKNYKDVKLSDGKAELYMLPASWNMISLELLPVA
ncbi:MAG: alpha-N-arabinofuranosidase [Spirochaetales bacterium]|nr:alpha-N-arabinofuranosidase [Spirochaetales bacterium]